MYLKHVITAGILSAALAIGPGAAFAQTSGSSSSTSGTSSQGTTSQPQSGTTTSSGSSASRQAGSGGSGADQEAVRQHLSAAREALAELTKLPAASQLQGEQRQQVAQLIGDFNSFATATTDWRAKYDTIDHELDQILGVGATGTTSESASGSATGASASGSASAAGTPAAATGTSGSAGATGAPAAAGAAGAAPLDPAIIAKLREVRTHLDGFEEASGDPTFVVEKIEKILDQAAGGASASGAVGTSGSSAGGSVTLTAAQLQELRRQLETIKAAAKR